MEFNSTKDDQENKNSDNKKAQITLNKFLGQNSNDLKQSPFLYLLQIATDERRLKQNKNYLKRGFSLYSNDDKNNSENDFLNQDIEYYIREIVEKKDEKFLSGETNLFDFLISKYLNIEKEKISIQENLTLKIDLQVDDYNFLNEFGIKMPNLANLNLENSILKNISNVGISFKNLKVLNVCKCQIDELEGNNRAFY